MPPELFCNLFLSLVIYIFKSLIFFKHCVKQNNHPTTLKCNVLCALSIVRQGLCFFFVEVIRTGCAMMEPMEPMEPSVCLQSKVNSSFFDIWNFSCLLKEVCIIDNTFV